MNRIIGIDLGTTNSCMAVMEGGAIQVVPNREGGRTTPSIVAFTDKGERLVGQIAKRQAVTNYRNTIFAVKRLIGRKFFSTEVQQARQIVPYELTESGSGDVRIRVPHHDYSPQEISAIVLQKMKASAEEYLGGEVEDAIVTVPAYFDDVQRQATKDAGTIAGLNVVRIINEPTAAALAYGLGKKESEKIAVFDLGGGTFDISILELNNGVYEVLATCGDSFLGGEDFDQRIVEWIIAEFQRETSMDLRRDRLALQRVKEAAEKAKCELSIATETSISLPFIAADAVGPKHFTKTLTRAKFEQSIVDLIERTVKPCEQAMADARVSPEQVDHVILVGGQTRTPAVRARVEQLFQKSPSREINPDEVVAIGAAIQGGVLSGQVRDVVLLDVIPLSLGVETQGGVFTKFLDRNTTIPTRKTMVFTTVADQQSTVDIHVLQGERELAAHNRSLARFELVGIEPAPKSVPQIDVTFDVNADGILSVSARDQLTGKEQSVRVKPSSGLTQAEINTMIADAQRYAEQDRYRREVSVLSGKLFGAVQLAERSFEEFHKLLSPAEQTSAKESLAKAQRAYTSDHLDLLREALDLVEGVNAQLRRALIKAEKKAAANTGENPPSEPAPEEVEKTPSELAREFLQATLKRKE